MSLFDRVKSLFSRPSKTPDAVGDDSAPGWDAIDAVVDPLYTGQEPQHWGTVLSWMAGGPDPLDGVSAYRADGPPSHWHYVTYGLTELYAKDSDDPKVSGWGFELTFRLKRNPEDDVAPVWPVNLLQNLARYVFDSGHTFGHGHYIDCNSPIAAETTSDLVALLFLRDSELPPIDTPHGRVEFLQAIGLTSEEHDACRAWSSEGIAEVLRRANPLLVTDLARTSVLEDAEVARIVEEGQARDGSNSASLQVDSLALRKEDGRWIIEMTATGFGALAAYLRGRTAHGREFAIVGHEQAVVIRPGANGVDDSEDSILRMTLSPESAAALAAVSAEKRGTYDVMGVPVSFDVRPALIRDKNGEIVREVG